MVDIVVKRGAGLNPGDEIVDPLVSTVPAALSRGRAELDKQSSGAQSKTYTVPFVVGRRHGQLEELHDVEIGKVVIGKITGLHHHGQGGQSPQAWTDVTLEVPSGVFV